MGVLKLFLAPHALLPYSRSASSFAVARFLLHDVSVDPVLFFLHLFFHLFDQREGDVAPAVHADVRHEFVWLQRGGVFIVTRYFNDPGRIAMLIS